MVEKVDLETEFKKDLIKTIEKKRRNLLIGLYYIGFSWGVVVTFGFYFLLNEEYLLAFLIFIFFIPFAYPLRFQK